MAAKLITQTIRWMAIIGLSFLILGCNDNKKTKESCTINWNPTFSFGYTTHKDTAKLIWDKPLDAQKGCEITHVHYTLTSNNNKIHGDFSTRNIKTTSIPFYIKNTVTPTESCSESLTLRTAVTLENKQTIQLPDQFAYFYIRGKNNGAELQVINQYVSPDCLSKLKQNLSQEFKHPICLTNNSGFTEQWMLGTSKEIIKNPKNNIRSPFGPYAGSKLSPYANSAGYYFSGTNNIFSRSIKNSKFIMGNYNSQVNGSPENRIISWAFPPQGCPKKGCPVLILFPGGANHAMDQMQLNPNTPANISPAETIFSDAWYWPESEHYPKSGFDFNYGYYVRMKILQAALKQGYAVIGLNPEINRKTVKNFDKNPWDDWSFAPQYCPNNKKPSVCAGKNPDPKVCEWQNADSFLWPGSDKGFLNKFFKEFINLNGKRIIYSNYTGLLSDIERVKGNRKINLAINPNDIFMMGYSSGAQMVSRMINEFALPFPKKSPNPKAAYSNKNQDNENTYWLPTLNGKSPDEKKANNLLKIKGAILLAGGSYYSYSNCPSTMPPPLGNSTSCLNCEYCGKAYCSNTRKKHWIERFFKKDMSLLEENCVLSNNFYLGYVDVNSGCGSDKMLEASYQIKNDDLTQNPLATWKNHPPVLLAQSNYDSYANRNVSKFYYFLMKNHKNSQYNVYRISSNNPTSGHFYFAEMVIPSINLMLKYTDKTDKKCNIFSGKNCPRGAKPAPHLYALTHKNDQQIFNQSIKLTVGGKRILTYPTDGYGKYVYCNNQELAYLGIRIPHSLLEEFPEKYTLCKTLVDDLPSCKK